LSLSKQRFLLIGGLALADEQRGDRPTPIEDLYSEYTVYEMHYERIGVDDLFVKENDQPEYVGATPNLVSLCKGVYADPGQKSLVFKVGKGLKEAPPRRDLVSSQSTFSTSTPASYRRWCTLQRMMA
jgi:hypothetical protein